MKRNSNGFLAWGLSLICLLTSCGEDRSGEYYALIQTKTWIYEVMQQYYLFYEDIPSEDRVDYFDKPQEFLKSVVSDKDGKNGTIFSHVDSVFTESRATSTYPCFGFEAALIRTEEGNNVMRVLYTQPSSPASEAGLKRGDWIIAVDNKEISASDYYTDYIERPKSSHTFTLGKYNPYTGNGDNPDEEEGEYTDYVEFDTLGTVQLPAPRYVEEQDVLDSKIITVGSHKALYILYNEFGETSDAIENIISQATGQFDNIILDLRYNPGGYVSTSQRICTLLAPQTAMGQPMLNMIYNDKINMTETLTFDNNLIPTGGQLQYNNLYVITSGNTASASEVVINCLRPYMSGRIIQIGAPTFGKNVAQQLFTDESAPNIELWLTTTYLSNSEGYYEYYDNGLLPDYEMEEDISGTLGEFGTDGDQLMAPVFYHIMNGGFPVTESPEDGSSAETLSRNGYRISGCRLLGSSIDKKPRLNLLDK